MPTENHCEVNTLLSDESQDLHRALVSLKEELEAVDWYQQRAEATGDKDLRDVLVHNQNEEIEHAAMILEWLRRHHPVFSDNIGVFINSSGSIAEVPKTRADQRRRALDSAMLQSLGIGSLKGMK